MAVVNEFGFMPNIVPRNLVQKRSSTLALIASNIYSYPKLIVLQIEAQARIQGYQLMIDVIDTTEEVPPIRRRYTHSWT